MKSKSSLCFEGGIQQTLVCVTDLCGDLTNRRKTEDEEAK